MKKFLNQTILGQIKEIKEVDKIEEAMQMLTSGNWIALYAASSKFPTKFCMGRVDSD
jgi:ABC-type enterochelin transport system substrate-binding protein|nr:MAG TPA: hypothetical protein [Caudoviricetes sp.]